MRRIALALVAALVLAGLLAPATSTAAGRTKVSATGSPQSLTVGDSFVLRIRTVRAAVGQRATVQRRVGSTWRRVRTATLPGSRKLDLTITPPVGTQRYRVRLARRSPAGAATSRPVTVTVRPVQQTAGLSLASSAIVGDEVTATATFTPRRPGRAVQLQRNASGTWQVVATRSQDAQGRAAFAIPTEVQGATAYRAVAVPSAGLAAATSPVRTITVAGGGAWSEETVLVSHDLNGGPANDYSQSPSISDDGRFVAYDSDATDLVADDPDNDRNDIFLWDRETDTTVLVTRTFQGGGITNDANQPVISGNGRYVAYATNAPDIVDVENPFNDSAVYRWDRLTGETILVSHNPAGGIPDNGSGDASISDSGSFIAFSSGAHDLTADDYSNQTSTLSQIFRWSAASGDVVDDTILVSKRADGDPATNTSTDPHISDQGHAIAFTSRADDLDVALGTPMTAFIRKAFVWRSSDSPRITALVDRFGGAVDQEVLVQSISGTSGRIGIYYAGSDLVSEDLGGVGNALVWQPAHAQPVVLASHAPGSTAAADQASMDMQLSGTGLNGSFRSFDSLTEGDDGNDYDLFAWHDGAVSRIGLPAGGGEPTNNAGRHALSGDGQWVVFESYATNLVAFPTTSLQIFVTGTG